MSDDALMKIILDHARKLASEGDVQHRWSKEGMCPCGVSEASVSDDGVCERELENLLIRMAGFVIANCKVYGLNGERLP